MNQATTNAAMANQSGADSVAAPGQMAGNLFTGSFWVVVVFIGAFALFAAIVWARRRNKVEITPEQERRSEAATRDLYQDPVEHDRFNP